MSKGHPFKRKIAPFVQVSWAERQKLEALDSGPGAGDIFYGLQCIEWPGDGSVYPMSEELFEEALLERS